MVTALLAVFVLLGLAGFWGGRSEQVADTGDGWRLEVTFVGTARPGMDVPFEIVVGCVDPPCTGERLGLAVDRQYIDMFESQRFFPEPEAESGDREQVVLEYAAPDPGAELAVFYDAYVQPTQHRGRDGAVQLLVDGVPGPSVTFRTSVMP